MVSSSSCSVRLGVDCRITPRVRTKSGTTATTIPKPSAGCGVSQPNRTKRSAKTTNAASCRATINPAPARRPNRRSTTSCRGICESCSSSWWPIARQHERGPMSQAVEFAFGTIPAVARIRSSVRNSHQDRTRPARQVPVPSYRRSTRDRNLQSLPEPI